jgi:hypothetical protein
LLFISIGVTRNRGSTFGSTDVVKFEIAVYKYILFYYYWGNKEANATSTTSTNDNSNDDFWKGTIGPFCCVPTRHFKEPSILSLNINPGTNTILLTMIDLLH